MPRQLGLALTVVAVVGANGIFVRGSQSKPQSPQAPESIPPLVEAIWQEDLEKVKQLLADGADPNATMPGLPVRPAWMWAIVARDDRAVDLLLSKLDKADRPNALLFAANRNDVPLARALFGKGMPVDARGIDGASALLIAAASGHVEMIRLLIDRGASVNLADDFGDTALMAAVRAGSLDSVNLLLAAGADVNARDDTGRSTFTWAVRSRRQDVMRVLLDNGARGDTAGDSRTPLSPRAAVERSLPLIQRGTATWNERQSCGSCHHHPLMFRAVATGERAGVAIDKLLFDAQIARLGRRFETGRRSGQEEALLSDAGVLRWSLRTGGDPSFGTPWFLSSFADAGLRLPGFERETLLLARMQLQDGRWRHAPPRVPIMSSDFTATATAIRTLRAFGAPQDAAELGQRVQRAVRWLRSTTPATTDDKAFHMFGLHWAGADATLIEDALTRLRQEQNPDGGWAQLKGLNSDAYATGMVLVALHEAGRVPADDLGYQRGVKYLLETQEPDGSWLVHKRAVPINTYFESGFPHGKFQFISYAGTCWATMALAYAATPSIAGELEQIAPGSFASARVDWP